MAELRSRGDLSGLRAASRYDDVLWDRDERPIDLGAPVRAQAVRALSEFYGPEVVEALYEAVGDRDASVRRTAVTGLLELDSPAAATALIAALADWPENHDSQLRAEAANGLAAMDASGLPEAYAARLLGSGRTAAAPFDQHVLETLLAADVRGDAARSALIDFLVSRLEDRGDGAGTVAERLLEWLAADSVEPLLGCLDDERRRLTAARLLGVSHDARAVDPLVRMLSDPQPRARATAALSLGQLRHANSVEPLLQATRDDDYDVRDAAMSALDAMGAAAVTVGLAALGESAVLNAGRDGGGVRQIGPDGGSGPAGGDGDAPRERQPPVPWAERVLTRLLGPGPGAP